MELAFGDLLDVAGLDRGSVRLLRHQENKHTAHRSIYAVWRDNRQAFEAYQATQAISDEPKLRAPLWASFVALPGRQTLFIGMYSAGLDGLLREDRTHPITGATEEAETCNFYSLAPRPELAGYAGRLLIDWGAGFRSWIQRADSAPKRIVELRPTFSEPPFPGFQNLVINLSEIGALPSGWVTALASTRGIYLLTCPQTREQYVGQASGATGFMGRWREYFSSGHGGNIGLKSRDPSDYQVSILETLGSSATLDDLFRSEQLWKRKLQSQEMGLNRN
ncbi:GIY-YIG nuclease family protein [Bosea sp. UC22_33]|uniref:GIY-YIG nuclease family protein n=1 Tax=Bosea sp. UC22_33 TaxID=3350165 RepID=UPI00366FAFD4